MKDSRIVFMGTPDFAVEALRQLHAACNVVAVVTQPDKPSGRGKKLSFSAVKKAAMELGIPVAQPEKVRDKFFIEWLKNLSCDFIITAAYGKILPTVILDIPKIAALNIHASILPAYRGSAPIHRAVINGEKESGVTIMMMDEGMDTGDIILCEKLSIGANDTTGIVHDKLAELGAKLIIRAVHSINKCEYERIKQDDTTATYAPPLLRADEKINWCLDTITLHNLIRGMNPWPGVYTEIHGDRLKIGEGRPAEGSGSPCGLVLAVEKDGLVVATKNGAYRITKMQPAGKKMMPVADFLRGYPVEAGVVLGK